MSPQHSKHDPLSQAIVDNGAQVSFIGPSLKKGTPGERTPTIENAQLKHVTDIELKILQQTALAWEINHVPCNESGSEINDSAVYRLMAAHLTTDYYEIGCFRGMKERQLLGGMGFTGNQDRPVDFLEDDLIKAIRTGGIVCLKNANHLPKDLLVRLRPLLDELRKDGTDKVFYLEEDEGQPIKIHPDFRLVLSVSSPGLDNPDAVPLDEPTMGRLLYSAFPNELPDDIRESRALARLGIPTNPAFHKAETLRPNLEFDYEKLNAALSLEQKAAFFEAFDDFVTWVDRAVRRDELGKSAIQNLSIDYERHREMVLDFVARYYDGDLDSTAKKGLQRIIQNKFTDKSDYTKVGELIRMFTIEKSEAPQRKSYAALPSRRDGVTGILDGGASLLRYKAFRDQEGGVIDLDLQERMIEAMKSASEERGAIQIGRNTIWADVVASDETVSGMHCLLVRTGFNEWEIEDQDSRNGTFVNEVEVTRKRVVPGDIIRIGPHAFRIPDFSVENQMEDIALENLEVQNDRLESEQKIMGMGEVFSQSVVGYPAHQEKRVKIDHAAIHSLVNEMGRENYRGRELFTAGTDAVEFINGTIKYVGVGLSRMEKGERTQNFAEYQKDILTEYDVLLRQTIAICHRLGRIPVLEGGPGIGKSRIAAWMAASRDEEYFHFVGRQCSSKALLGQTRGSKTDPTGYELKKGPGRLAIENGGTLFYDEANAGSPELNKRMRDLAKVYLEHQEKRRRGDNSPTYFKLSEATGSASVPLHDSFKMIWAQNEATEDGLTPLSREDFSLLAYIKLPDQLPKEVRKARFLGCLGVQPQVKIREMDYLTTENSITLGEFRQLFEQDDHGALRKMQFSEMCNDLIVRLDALVNPEKDSLANKDKIELGYFKRERTQQSYGALSQNDPQNSPYEKIRRQQQVHVNLENQREVVERFMMEFYNHDPLNSFRQGVLHVFGTLFASSTEKKVVLDILHKVERDHPEITNYFRSLRKRRA